MKKYNLYQIDSFTKKKFSGNPAGVITNADGLNECEMQKVARELNNSETAFVFSSNSSEYDVHVRFFTPTSEVPICGHATIAAHYARAVENKFKSLRVYQKTGAGVLPVDIIKENGDYKIVMTQGKVEFGSVIEGINKEKLLRALNIKNSDLMENYQIQIVSTGHSKVMVGIKSIETLNAISPNYDALSKLSDIIKCNGYYVFTVDPNEEDNILIHGRMFAPAIGIKEDPVTGNANGPLGAYLVYYNLVNHDNSVFKFKAKQGEAIGREGIIEVEVKIENKKPVCVKVSGNALIVFKSELIC
ncbi:MULTISPECIES: PhzF family isomerase [Clostridium]|uniref:PhzF family isomerase n=1 Tax=Clostridium TaxID=1485 RepID=UPI000826164D|nr:MULTISPECIES: PhzF family isomerase [Clostridium]PJI08588.1 PhzF family protein [Clostridium sp. CT7]